MPVNILPTRVWRNYAGGRLLDEAQGVSDPHDGRFPEDWIASTTLANNRRVESPPDEGLSRYRTADGREGLLTDLVPNGMGVLAKFIDPCERLQVQWHPDPLFAEAHFGIRRGKTELWIGFGERHPGAGHGWLGQCNGWSRDDWRRAIDRQDTPAMLEAMNRIRIVPGEAWLVPSGIPHCIGGGGLYLEVQEPTDFTVRCEYLRNGIALPESQRWMGLDQERALDCLRAEPVDPEKLKMRLREKDGGPGWRRDTLCGPEDCGCFSVDRISIEGKAVFPVSGPAAAVILEGRGLLCGMPAGARSRFAVLPEERELGAEGRFCMLVCSGPVDRNEGE